MILYIVHIQRHLTERLNHRRLHQWRLTVLLKSQISPSAFWCSVQAQTERGGGEEAHQQQVLRLHRWEGVQPAARHRHRHRGHSTRVVSVSSFTRLSVGAVLHLMAATPVLKVRLLHCEPSRQHWQRLADTLQRHLRHQWPEARSHAAAHLQAVPHVLQLAGE